MGRVRKERYNFGPEKRIYGRMVRLELGKWL